ncbi:MAG: helix-turn-helix domain-containing protein [Bdellovibrionales bacterium]|nr:helix-turn-helix domain-containing protein [Bdellovibrionales bacterium]
MIGSFFNALGFNQNEIKVFLSLAEVGKSPASIIAKRVRIPRTTAYSVLDKLVEKGVVSVEHRGSSSFYTANPPNSLLRIIEKEKEELKFRESAAKNLVELINPFFKGTNFSIPKFQFYEGDKNLKNMFYDNLPIWRESVAKYDYTWWGYQDHTWAEQNLDHIEYSWKTASPKEKLKFFTNQSTIEVKISKKYKRREIKLVPAGIDFSSSIWVLGDYIVLVMTRHKPNYAYQLKDPVFSKNLRSVFQMLWAATD